MWTSRRLNPDHSEVRARLPATCGSCGETPAGVLSVGSLRAAGVVVTLSYRHWMVAWCIHNVILLYRRFELYSFLKDGVAVCDVLNVLFTRSNIGQADPRRGSGRSRGRGGGERGQSHDRPAQQERPDPRVSAVVAVPDGHSASRTANLRNPPHFGNMEGGRRRV